MEFDLWIFHFDITSLISFFVGIFVGCALLCLVYVILVLFSLKSKKYVITGPNQNVTDEEIKCIIDNSTQAFKDKELKGAKGTIAYTKDICISLVKDISRKYYPKSKRPFAELSIDEVLKLAIYVSNRINELVDRPALRLLKKIKVSTILSLGDAKKVIDDSELAKLTKKYQVKKVFNTVKGALNIVNPVYWIKKGLIDTSLDIALKKVCECVIGIVGEETFKVYSKRVFNEERIIDTGVDLITNELETDLKEVTDDDMDKYLSAEILNRKE